MILYLIVILKYNETIMDIISTTHSILAFLLAFYGILFTRSRFDYLILIIIFTTLLSWTLYKGECPISYYIKKHNDPNYTLGTDIHAEDMYILFGEKYIPHLKFFYTFVSPLIQTITLYLLFKRQKFTSLETILYPILYYAYYYIHLQTSIANLCFTFIFAFILYRIVLQFIKKSK